MKYINRKTAILFLAIKELMSLNDMKRKSFIEDILLYEGRDIPESMDVIKFDSEAIDYISEVNAGVSNDYLSSIIKQHLGIDVKIIGDVKKLVECPCCKYFSLEERGAYEICRVCFWEDDGSNDMNRYSFANKMKLGEAQVNFKRIGAINEQAISGVDKDGTKKYQRWS